VARRRSRKGYALFLLPGALLSIVVIVVPLLMNIGISFTSWRGIGTPEWIGLENYTRLLEDERFWMSFRNILVLIVAMVIVPTMVGLVLAALLVDYMAPRFGRRTANTFRSGFYLPQVIPVAVTGIIWAWILNPNFGALNRILDSLGMEGLSQNWLGDPTFALPSVMVALIWVQIGYPVVMFMSGLQRVDPELHEAASIDGASWWQQFARISVHMVRPELYVVLVTTTIATLKVFAQVFVLTRGGPGNATLVPAYFAYLNFFGQRVNVGYGAAIATVLTIIIVALTFLFLRAQTRDERIEGI
jgi:raffinose/stachyose/melibiose transport system permease protein